MKILPVGAEMFPAGGPTDTERQRDGHVVANNRFSQILRTSLKRKRKCRKTLKRK